MAKGAATAPTFTMPGGTIKNSNTSDTGFPKVQPNGSATVSGGEIYHNIASKGNGGGIYVHSTDNDVEVKILGGTVQYNAADHNGGGLCVDMSDADGHKATITIGNEDVAKRDTLSPDIRLNSAALSCGGMAVQGSGSNITLYSGTVKGNVSAFVKNEDIRNDGGTVELVGKNEEGKTPQVNVHYNTGTKYTADGRDPNTGKSATMNITSDVSLYAQWEKN